MIGTVIAVAIACSDDADPAAQESGAVAAETPPTLPPLVFPGEMPDDFVAESSWDGGLDWRSDDIAVRPNRASIERGMNGTTISLSWTPDSARVESLYGEIVNGRFDLYEVHQPVDLAGVDGMHEEWTVLAGGVLKDLALNSGDDLRAPAATGDPLAAISSFPLLGSRTFEHSTEIVLDASIQFESGNEFLFDFGDRVVAIGENSDADRVLLHWDGDLGSIPVQLSYKGEVTGSAAIVIEEDRPVHLFASPEQGPAVFSSAPSGAISYVDHVYEMSIPDRQRQRYLALALSQIIGTAANPVVTVLDEERIVVRVIGGTGLVPLRLHDYAVTMEIAPMLSEDWRGPFGPAVVGTAAVHSAGASDQGDGRSVIGIYLREGSPGVEDLNAVGPGCVARSAECPVGRVVVIVDGEVVAEVHASSPQFDRQIASTRGVTHEEASDLANSLIIGSVVDDLEFIAVEPSTG